MSTFMQRMLRPEGYHGRRTRPPFFEGWYMKVIDATEAHRYAVIPGVSLTQGPEGPHSFVQVLDGITGATIYQRYPVTAFSASETAFDVRVGPNHFTQHGMVLDLAETDIPLQGHLAFHDTGPWPVTPPAPGIMGPFAWVPRMECYHGVLSLDHAVTGSLTTASGRYSFDGGRGYIEKDWGQAFPSGWVWMQTNHFGAPEEPHPGISLTASIAMIPWIGFSFPGFIVGLLWQNTLYRFATYTGAVTRRLVIGEETVDWALEDAVYRLEITAHRVASGDLRGPSRADMGRRVPETLSASIDVTLSARLEGRVLFTGTGRCAGLEVGGETAPLCRVD